MAKTSKEILQDVRRLLLGSSLQQNLSGNIFFSRENRPKDSTLEDILIIFTTGVPDQVEKGVITINIFYNDHDPYSSGNFIENEKRGAVIEALAKEWINSLTAGVSNYKFKLLNTITSFKEDNTNQHFIVIKLGYDYFGNE